MTASNPRNKIIENYGPQGEKKNSLPVTIPKPSLPPSPFVGNTRARASPRSAQHEITERILNLGPCASSMKRLGGLGPWVEMFRVVAFLLRVGVGDCAWSRLFLFRDYRTPYYNPY